MTCEHAQAVPDGLGTAEARERYANRTVLASAAGPRTGLQPAPTLYRAPGRQHGLRRRARPPPLPLARIRGGDTTQDAPEEAREIESDIQQPVR